jgi:hypothetical protein
MWLGLALSVDASRERTPTALDAVLRRAGAVFAHRHGHPVAVSYGSAAGELAACVSAAGIADSSELTKLELGAPRAQLQELVKRMTGWGVAPGGLLHAGGAWWCGAPGAGGRVIVLCEPQLGERVRRHLAACADRPPALLVRDRTDDWAAITVLGAATAPVLAALGVFGESGDPRRVPPFTPTLSGTRSNALGAHSVSAAWARMPWRATSCSSAAPRIRRSPEYAEPTAGGSGLDLISLSRH